MTRPPLSLTIATPLALAVADEAVTALTAEDASGRFGLLPGHADLLTVLEISVLSWTGPAGRRHCALRGGVLSVTGGRRVAVSSREAVVDADLDHLSDTVLARFREEQEAERVEHVDATRLQLAAIRQIITSLGAHPGPHLGDGLP